VLDGQVHQFETHTETIKVKQPDGTTAEEALVVRRSLHGPVVADRLGCWSLFSGSVYADGVCKAGATRVPGQFASPRHHGLHRAARVCGPRDRRTPAREVLAARNL